MRIDLHTHSTYSDGTLEPADVVRHAHGFGITHMALSDHDSTGGLNAARAQAKEYGMEIIPAVEINTQETEVSVHVLGYYLDENDEKFQATLRRHREIRQTRAKMILEKLHHMGIKISLSDFSGEKDAAAVGRPHIADKLKEKGVVFSRKEAFDKFLAKGKPAYVFYQGPTPKDAIEIILGAKGIPVIAHPGYYVSEQTIASLAELGLQGIEVNYPTHSSSQRGNFVQIAQKYNLVVTGGSDYHGPGSGHEAMGDVEAPQDAVDKLLARKQKLFG